jgi:hypothetical protein
VHSERLTLPEALGRAGAEARDEAEAKARADAEARIREIEEQLGRHSAS